MTSATPQNTFEGGVGTASSLFMTLLRQLTAGAHYNNKTLCCFRALGINKKIKTNIFLIQVSIHEIVGSMIKNSFCSYRGFKLVSSTHTGQPPNM